MSENTLNSSKPITVEVWSDVACPFCYMGLAAFRQALAQLPQDNVEVTYRSFQLSPQLPERFEGTAHEFLAEEQGVPVAQAMEMHKQLSARAETLGLDFQIDAMILGNTRTAHRLIHFAKKAGKQSELIERLFRAHYTDGLFIGDFDVLADLAQEVGLDWAEARAALDSGAHDEDVDSDIQRAGEKGIRGVPHYIINDKYTLSGAQPVEVFVDALSSD